jgi:mannosyltransferase OCH1-like enzyme
MHVIWIGGHDAPQKLIDSWAEMNPKFIFTVWRDHTKGWKNQRAIDEMREWNGKADIMRLEILAAHGGVAIDADSLALRPLEEGPEKLLENDKAFAFYENEAVRPGLVGCGVMGAPKDDPFFAACVARVAQKDMTKPAWTTVGPQMVTDVAKMMPDKIKVYPSKWVHPKHFSGAPAPGVQRINPYCEQMWGGTKGYNSLRDKPCSCRECYVGGSALRPSWG